MNNRSWSAGRVAAVVVAFALAFGAMRGQAHADAREIKAREDFAAGRFQEALDIFARLYAETLHPIYLRNIGRCYQNLGNPDRAIATFRDYLHKAKGLSSDEQKEIEGYIKEMEDLKRQRESAAATPSAAPAATSAPVTPLPSATATPSPSAAPEPTTKTQTQAVLVGTPNTTAAPAESPIYTKWWFWTLVGAVVIGAGAGVLAATGTFNKTENAPCPTSNGFVCPR